MTSTPLTPSGFDKRTVRRLVRQLFINYGWRLTDEAQFAHRVMMRLNPEDPPEAVESAACGLHFEDLYYAIQSGGLAAQAAWDELLTIEWGPDGVVIYRGYLYRSAWLRLRRRFTLAIATDAFESFPPELNELAQDAATLARTKLEAHFGTIRHPERFLRYVSRLIQTSVVEALRAWQGRSVAKGLIGLDELGMTEASTEEMRYAETEMIEVLKHKARRSILSEEQINIIIWIFWEQWPYKMIAQRLTEVSGRATDEDRVAQLKFHALRKLRDNLREFAKKQSSA